MVEGPVRAASVGLGQWAEMIAEGVGRATGIRIVGCFSRSEDRRQAFSGKYGCRAYPSYDAVLIDPEIEAVLLTTPHSVHHRQILAAARALGGGYVFVEKPMTSTVTDGKEAIGACAAAEVALMVGHCWRRMGPIRRLKALLEEGVLGTVFQAVGHFGNPRALHLGQDQWRDDPGESPGGPLTGAGFHIMDISRYLLGPAARVCAVFQRRLGRGEADDTAGVMLEFVSGAFVLVRTNFLSPPSYRLSLRIRGERLRHPQSLRRSFDSLRAPGPAKGLLRVIRSRGSAGNGCDFGTDGRVRPLRAERRSPHDRWRGELGPGGPSGGARRIAGLSWMGIPRVFLRAVST